MGLAPLSSVDGTCIANEARPAVRGVGAQRWRSARILSSISSGLVASGLVTVASGLVTAAAAGAATASASALAAGAGAAGWAGSAVGGGGGGGVGGVGGGGFGVGVGVGSQRGAGVGSSSSSGGGGGGGGGSSGGGGGQRRRAARGGRLRVRHEPGAAQRLLRSGPALRLELQAAAHELHGLLGYSVPVGRGELVVAAPYDAQQLLLLLRVEGREAAEEYEGHHAH